MEHRTKTQHRAEGRSDQSVASLWTLVSDPRSWPLWNSSAQELELDGPFAEGSTGRLTPPGGEPLPFVLTEVVEGRTYSSRTQIASTVSLESTLELTAEPEGTLVVQHSALVGPAAEHFAASFGAALVEGVEATVATLTGDRL